MIMTSISNTSLHIDKNCRSYLIIFTNISLKTKIHIMAYISVFLEICFERFHIVIKAKCCHGKQDVFSIDGLPFLLMTSLTSSGIFVKEQLEKVWSGEITYLHLNPIKSCDTPISQFSVFVTIVYCSNPFLLIILAA